MTIKRTTLLNLSIHSTLLFSLPQYQIQDQIKTKHTVSCVIENLQLWRGRITASTVRGVAAITVVKKLCMDSKRCESVNTARSNLTTIKLTSSTSWGSSGEKQTRKCFWTKFNGIRLNKKTLRTRLRCNAKLLNSTERQFKEKWIKFKKKMMHSLNRKPFTRARGIKF